MAQRKEEKPRWTPRLLVQRRSVGYFGTSWYTRAWVRFTVGTLAVLALIVVVFGGGLWLEYKSCSNKGEVLGTEFQWRVVGGCFLQVEDGRYVPANNYRVTERGD